VRGIAATGATILVEKGHEPALRALLEAPYTNPADELASRRAAQQPTGSIEVYEGKKIIADGGQSLELHAITGSPHVEPMVIAFVPMPGALFQSDLFFPGTGGNFNPAAQHLLESVRKLALRVTTNVGGHGGVGPFAELVKAGTPPAAKTVEDEAGARITSRQGEGHPSRFLRRCSPSAQCRARSGESV
jgi:hypothetical protein